MAQSMIPYLPLLALLPLLAGVAVFLFGRRLPGRGAPFTIATMGGCLAFAVLVLPRALDTAGGPALDTTLLWFSAAGARMEAGFLLDPLTGVMLLVVTLVSFLVQIYSTEYMHDDPGYHRYFAYLSVFTSAMLLLVITNSFLLMFIAWELVGLCSYLLIGFWYEKKSASDAAKKAFLTTKAGDVGFLLGLLLLFSIGGSFRFDQLYAGTAAALSSGAVTPGLLALALILLFLGAVGKSAQFPLHVWLPDAMEGPTPVSALIHAATMVAAGVYLVGRAFPLFLLSKAALLFVAYTGAVTALFAASIGLVQTDIKKVLAYSTVSQLGYMILGLGVGGYVSGLFHLVTHAFFKALLFLGSGSVIHALHNQDIRRMGGLWRVMRVTAITFLLGSLSIAGIPPFAGFFSKDAILADALAFAIAQPLHLPLFLMAACAAFMTAFYMFRLFFLTFLGESCDAHAHPHESGRAICGPLALLAVLAVTAGGFSGTFAKAMGTPAWTADPAGGVRLVFESVAHAAPAQDATLAPAAVAPVFAPALGAFRRPDLGAHLTHAIHLGVSVGSVVVASLGILLAWLMYRPGKPALAPARLVAHPAGAFLHRLLLNKYYVDELYAATVVAGARGLARLLFAFDRHVVDGVVNGAAAASRLLARAKHAFDRHVVDGLVHAAGDMTRLAGRGFSCAQSGFVQSYLLLALVSIVLLLAVAGGRL